MGFFSDNLGFETFQFKDWWNKAKDNPEQLLLGAGDPLSAKMWSKITGKNYEPFVDQMGGPYGGHTISAFGANDGGVYGRAEQAGINTKAAGGVHDGAHVLAAMLAGGYGMGAMGGGGAAAAPASGGITSGLTSGFGSGLGSVTGGTAGGATSGGLLGGMGWGGAGTATSGLGVFGGGGTQGLLGVGGGNAGTLAANGGISGGAGMGSATAPAQMGMQDYLKMAQQMGGQQQQQQQPGAPAQQAPTKDPLALRMQLARNARAQELRRKPTRTQDENLELRQLTRTGLLG